MITLIELEAVDIELTQIKTVEIDKPPPHLLARTYSRSVIKSILDSR